ncbi:hypothetical protein [Marinobacter sp. LV10R510-11A]|uniref:hypothetical protein n=1 Tax=Marinobacter sp. LV10R510-11A TaxID=1415568 RepID=UPI000BB8DD57|nr:hypothetical protein [Marinobacter sp. LV10R510-11A]
MGVEPWLTGCGQFFGQTAFSEECFDLVQFFADITTGAAAPDTGKPDIRGVINLQEMGLFVGRIVNVNAESLVDVQNADFPLTQ